MKFQASARAQDKAIKREAVLTSWQNGAPTDAGIKAQGAVQDLYVDSIRAKIDMLNEYNTNV
jgi:hypothetical protein